MDSLPVVLPASTQRNHWLVYGALTEHASLGLRGSRQMIRVFEEPRDDDDALRELRALEQMGDALVRTTLASVANQRSVLLDLIIELDDLLDELVALSASACVLPVQRRHPTALSLANVVHAVCRQLSLATTVLPATERSDAELRILVDIGVLLARAGMLWQQGMRETRHRGWSEVFRSFGAVVGASERCAARVEEMILER